ncbi:carboxypeptidase regulatory-like domain-containing protein, partial [bacterium]|nr:carboxypeptidase regulatory-like domain-containing protein [bacterium]
MKKLILILGVSLSFIFFAGCGSESVTTDATSSTMSGTVATGAGAAAALTFVGNNGRVVEGHSLSTGRYTVNTGGLTQPIVVRAILDRDGTTLYSFSTSRTGTTNVTPLTSYVVNQAAETLNLLGGAAQLLSSFQNTTVPSNVNTQIAAIAQQLSAALAARMTADNVSDFNHFTSAFNADHTGYDALLDGLDIELNEDDVIIRVDENTTLDTLNYDISVANIDFTGKVYNVQDNSNIAGAQITLTDSTERNISTTTDVNGTFTAQVQTMRVYDVTVEADGYVTQYIPNVSAFMLTTTNIGSVPMFPNTEVNATTVLTGSIFDGRTTDTGVADSTLVFRAGYNERLSTAVTTVTTDAYGAYSVELPVNVYTVQITNSAYYTRYVTVTVYGPEQTENLPIYANTSESILLNDAFAVITLDWSANPRDLDSHLTGPDTSSTRFHLAYYNKIIGQYTGDTQITCADGIIATLDRDDIDGVGPETTTLCSVEPDGIYKYYVHHYAGNDTMSEGNAVVNVRTANGTSRTYTAPTVGSTGYNDIWHV